jgi:MerR family transcriptional regulator, repressor of the yfmOP operon
MSTSTSREPRLRIGEVATHLGVTTRTIRYYEQLGLLGTPPDRQKGGHRSYSQADISRLEELIRLRDLLGLSLNELAALTEAEEARAMLRDRWHDSHTDVERLRIIKEATGHVRHQLDLVRARQQRLTEFATELESKLTSLAEREHDLTTRPPHGTQTR